MAQWIAYQTSDLGVEGSSPSEVNFFSSHSLAAPHSPGEGHKKAPTGFEPMITESKSVVLTTTLWREQTPAPHTRI